MQKIYYRAEFINAAGILIKVGVFTSLKKLVYHYRQDQAGTYKNCKILVFKGPEFLGTMGGENEIS
jgi:hypothetical protein